MSDDESSENTGTGEKRYFDEEQLDELQAQYDVEIADEVLKDMPLYTLVVFLAIPAMSVLGLFMVSLAYGAIALSALIGLVIVTILGDYKQISKPYNIFSMMVIVFISWGTIGILFSLNKPALASIIGGNMFSIGFYSLLRWNNKFLAFWRFEWLFGGGKR